jgi:beta-phosphoglucomutase-like phosphatase (HAD superfamily)
MPKNIFQNKKAVFFDFDGTLADSMGLWFEIDKVTLLKFGASTVPLDDLGRESDKFLHNNNSGDIYAKRAQFMIDRYGANCTVAEYFAERTKILIPFLREKLTYKPNADKFLNLLKKNGFELCLVSLINNEILNFYKTECDNLNRKADLSYIFGDKCVTIDIVNNKKPDPEAYLKAVSMLDGKISKEQCLIIEDSITGVTAGHRAGIDVVCIYDKYADPDREEIEKLSTHNVKNFAELILEFNRYIQ